MPSRGGSAPHHRVVSHIKFPDGSFMRVSLPQLLPDSEVHQRRCSAAVLMRRRRRRKRLTLENRLIKGYEVTWLIQLILKDFFVHSCCFDPLIFIEVRYKHTVDSCLTSEDTWIINPSTLNWMKQKIRSYFSDMNYLKWKFRFISNYIKRWWGKEPFNYNFHKKTEQLWRWLGAIVFTWDKEKTVSSSQKSDNVFWRL